MDSPETTAPKPDRTIEIVNGMLDGLKEKFATAASKYAGGRRDFLARRRHSDMEVQIYGVYTDIVNDLQSIVTSGNKPLAVRGATLLKTVFDVRAMSMERLGVLDLIDRRGKEMRGYADTMETIMKTLTYDIAAHSLAL